MAGEEVTPVRCEVVYHIMQELLGYITLMGNASIEGQESRRMAQGKFAS